MKTIAEIRGLLTKGKLKEAIDAMIELSGVNGDKDLQNSLILQSSRYQENERSNLSGIISSGDYSRSRARINYALLSYLDEMKDAPGGATTTSNSDSNGSSNNPISNNEGSPPTPAADITKILFLAANPSGTAKLQLGKEHGSISKKLQNSPTPERFRIRSKDAVSYSDFMEHIMLESPQIVHFSGHGEKANPEVLKMVSRGLDVEEEDIHEDDTGIILYDESKRKPFFVGTSAIQYMFKTMINDQGVPLNVVVFNNCYSQAQAEAVAEVVPYVIGTTWSVKDEAAIAFATGFYLGIANGKPVKAAMSLGIASALAYGEPVDRFVLYENGKKV